MEQEEEKTAQVQTETSDKPKNPPTTMRMHAKEVQAWKEIRIEYSAKERIILAKEKSEKQAKTQSEIEE